jgi:hypothetical protein
MRVGLWWPFSIRRTKSAKEAASFRFQSRLEGDRVCSSPTNANYQKRESRTSSPREKRQNTDSEMLATEWQSDRVWGTGRKIQTNQRKEQIRRRKSTQMFETVDVENVDEEVKY